RGGMGVVYLAREVELDRYVALKVLPPALAADQKTRARFLREARVAASLSHPNIVPIFRVGETDDVVFFTMAFVDGETLGDRLRARGPLAPSYATRLLRDVSQALAYSHGRGIVHRDIKPDNILIERDSGRALVSDFGIAAAALSDAQDRGVAGTRHFMSPEQSAGAAVDARSDIYSLGVVAFLSLSGRLPAPGQTLVEAAPSVPQHFDRAVNRALAVDPAGRFDSAEAFGDAVQLTTLARAGLPAPLREWLDTRDPWALPYAAWSLMGFTSGFLNAFRSGHAEPLPFVVGLAPAIPAMMFQLRIAKKVFNAGFTVDDLREAMAFRRAEREAEENVRAPWWHPFARAVAWLPVLAIVLPIAGGFNLGFFPQWALVYSALVAVVTLPGLTALGIPLFPRFMSAPEHTFSRRLWNSRVGRWIGNLLARGKPRAIAANAFRPTESVLGSAVGDLFAALPPAFREQLRDVPSIIERLQRHAQDAREHLTHLEGVTAVDRDAPLSAARDRARKQLAESVAAIESIRLDLLRLIGGDADLRPMTTALDAARKVDSDIARLRAARTEVERGVAPLGLDLRPHSPA
ncbi:MAG TPA: serine/threonine-protein kinase, partial [Gemmatimonadaceae bacterium]|nr:serine/threonine-protein kinase [Gemmatimonadaceae bacterium]